MKVKHLAPLAVLFCLLALPLCAALAAAEDDQIAQADQLYSQRKDHANVEKGITLLEGIVSKQANNYEVLWRLGKFYWYLGDRSKDHDTKLDKFGIGKKYAERATQAKVNSVEGHYWFGALIGADGEEWGILKSLFMVPSMRREIEKCLEIDKDYADARYLFAQLLWKVPGIAGGDRKKALEEARLCILGDGKDQIDHWLVYGQIAIANKEYDTARMALQKAISIPDDPEDPAVSKEDKATAAEELKSIEKKK
jgi:tetratricopeptide (TPR) repeat protein